MPHEIYHPFDYRMDALMYEWALRERLRKNPKLQKRQDDYRAARKAAYEYAMARPKDWLVSVLKWRNSAYIVKLLKADTHESLASRFAGTFTEGFKICK
jgi:hypothetical protein